MERSPHWPGIGRYLGLLIDKSSLLEMGQNRSRIARGEYTCNEIDFIPAGEKQPYETEFYIQTIDEMIIGCLKEDYHAG